MAVFDRPRSGQRECVATSSPAWGVQALFVAPPVQIFTTAARAVELLDAQETLW